jgi:hypothetical protein
MARKPNEFWRERIKALTVNNDAQRVRFGPESVLSALKADYDGLTEADQRQFGKPPSKATIGRIQHTVRAMPEKEREQYLWFYWPESMGTKELPWEASHPLLRLLAHDLWFRVRPQIPVCRWYWKLYQAAPGAPHGSLENMARMLATWEMQGSIPDRKFRQVEGWLAFRGWVTVEKGHRLSQMAHDMAVEFRMVHPLVIDFEEPAETTIEDMAARREMFSPINLQVARHEAQIELASRDERDALEARFRSEWEQSGPRDVDEEPARLKAWLKFMVEHQQISMQFAKEQLEQLELLEAPTKFKAEQEHSTTREATSEDIQAKEDTNGQKTT